MSADTAQVPGQVGEPPLAGDSADSATSGGNPGRTIAVVVFLAVAAVIALGGGESIPLTQSNVSADVAASLSVTSSELAQAAYEQDGVHGATGGYVPGVGIIVTTEIEELDADELSGWTRSLITEVGNVDQLPIGEEIIFLLDVAQPTRTSRLVSMNPAEVGEAGEMMGREAPATSTTPLVAKFEAMPERMASVDEDSDSGDEDE